VTFTDALPDEHGTVTGSPETIFFAVPLAEKVHVEALATLPTSCAAPPVHDTGEGLVLKVVMVGEGAGARVIVPLVVVVVFAGPAALSLTVNLRVVVVGLAATVTFADAVPELQSTVVGSPVTSGAVVENVHSDAFVTVADTVAEPPVNGTGSGVAARPEIVGFGGAAAIVIVVMAVAAAPTPSAFSLTVNVLGVEAVLAATVMMVEAEPASHVTVVGSPETVGALVENVQVDAPTTEADSVTGPPVYGRVAGVAA
jgi:hypothetical protein